eukprot:5486187-Pyramimonas_sp.AAC.1
MENRCVAMLKTSLRRSAIKWVHCVASQASRAITGDSVSRQLRARIHPSIKESAVARRKARRRAIREVYLCSEGRWTFPGQTRAKMMFASRSKSLAAALKAFALNPL